MKALTPLFMLLIFACGDDIVVDASVDTQTEAGCSNVESCDDGVFCNGAETCESGECAAGSAPCESACEEETKQCRTLCPDRDGDGAQDAACGGTDCDDENPNRFPGNIEICDRDNLDEDCDPATFGFRDSDGDNFPDSRCCNGDNCGSDCNDNIPIINPGASEVCDTFDNDCDLTVDESVQIPLWIDADGDGFGDASADAVMGCSASNVLSDNSGDCEDDNPMRHPAARELCLGDGVDENCDGDVDPPRDCDCTNGAERGCAAQGRCAAGKEICSDGEWGPCTVMPIPEVCNAEDDDCDGQKDEGLLIECYRDEDGDGYPAALATSVRACECTFGFTTREPNGLDIDCDDNEPNASPGVSFELCDGINNDCQGPSGALEDADRDRHASPDAACTGGFPKDDCNDQNQRVNPGQTTFFDTPYNCPCVAANTGACSQYTANACFGPRGPYEGQPGKQCAPRSAPITACVEDSSLVAFDVNCDESNERPRAHEECTEREDFESYDVDVECGHPTTRYECKNGVETQENAPLPCR